MSGTNSDQKLVNPQLIRLEKDFIANVTAVVFAAEEKTGLPEAKNFLLKGIRDALTNQGFSISREGDELHFDKISEKSEEQSIQDATHEITALLFDDIVSYELISDPVLLDSGHTLDRSTFETLLAAGMANPMTRGELKEIDSYHSAGKVTKVIAEFKHFLKRIDQGMMPSSFSTAELGLQHKDLPDYLQDIVPNYAVDDETAKIKVEKFSAYTVDKELMGRDLEPEILQPRQSQIAESVAEALQDLKHQPPLGYVASPRPEGASGSAEFEQEKRRREQARSDKPADDKRGIPPFALLLLFLSGAALASVGLSPFVNSLAIYQAFILFVTANGAGGVALAGIVLGVGILIMLGVLAYLFWPAQKPPTLAPAAAPMTVAAAAVAKLVRTRQQNIKFYPRLAAAAEAVQAPARAQRVKAGQEIPVDQMRASFLQVITQWLFKKLWAFVVYQQQAAVKIQGAWKAYQQKKAEKEGPVPARVFLPQQYREGGEFEHRRAAGDSARAYDSVHSGSHGRSGSKARRGGLRNPSLMAPIPLK